MDWSRAWVWVQEGGLPREWAGRGEHENGRVPRCEMSGSSARTGG
ncbi:hypothetical protein [Sporosarcina gallistercoris]|nr:hypothetical protein [Sporosarcina gallistercoris]